MNVQKKDSKKPELRIYIHLGDVSGNVCANVACNCIFIKYVTLFPSPPPPPHAAFYLFLNIFLSLTRIRNGKIMQSISWG